MYINIIFYQHSLEKKCIINYNIVILKRIISCFRLVKVKVLNIEIIDWTKILSYKSSLCNFDTRCFVALCNSLSLICVSNLQIH